MKTAEMKEILYNKLQAENTYFKKSDISIKKVKDYYIITIKDYEHISFKMDFEYDELFGYVVWVIDNEHNIISDTNSFINYDIEYALIELGYHIATRF